MLHLIKKFAKSPNLRQTPMLPRLLLVYVNPSSASWMLNFMGGVWSLKPLSLAERSDCLLSTVLALCLIIFQGESSKKPYINTFFRKDVGSKQLLLLMHICRYHKEVLKFVIALLPLVFLHRIRIFHQEKICTKWMHSFRCTETLLTIFSLCYLLSPFSNYKSLTPFLWWH